jgi:hypothetical protein
MRWKGENKNSKWQQAQIEELPLPYYHIVLKLLAQTTETHIGVEILSTLNYIH